jgi:hypothetical protein
MLKKITIVSSVFLAMTSLQTVSAQESGFSVSGDITGVSDYRFRGVSLSDKDPAIQQMRILVLKMVHLATANWIGPLVFHMITNNLPLG